MREIPNTPIDEHSSSFEPAGLQSPNFRPGVPFQGTLHEIAVWHKGVMEGRIKIDAMDVESMMLAHNVSLKDVASLLISYYKRIPEDRPERQEFAEQVRNIHEAIMFRRLFEEEFRVSRQRNADMELLVLRANSGDLTSSNPSSGTRGRQDEEYDAIQSENEALKKRVEELTKLL